MVARQGGDQCVLAAVLARKGGVRGRGGPDAISWTLKVAYSWRVYF